MTHIFLKTTESFTPGRTGFEARVNGQIIASGFCDKSKYPTFAYTAATDAIKRPYSRINKTFRPVFKAQRNDLASFKKGLAKIIELLSVLVFLFVVSTGYSTGTVNLRAQPTTHSGIIATLHEGDPVLIAPGPPKAETVEAWFQVLTFSGQGFIYSEYVEVQP